MIKWLKTIPLELTQSYIAHKNATPWNYWLGRWGIVRGLLPQGGET